MVRTYKELEAFKAAYALAMDVFWISRKFSTDESDSLTAPLRRSARSIATEVVEAWIKRQTELSFRQHVLEALGRCEETRVWIELASDCRYLGSEEYAGIQHRLDEVSSHLRKMYDSWRNFSR